MVTKAAVPVTTGAAKKGIGAWYAGHKPEALLGAAGIVVTLALYVRSKGASGAAAPTATPSTSTVMPGTLAPATGSYGNGGGDITGVESLLSQLSGQITALGTPAAPAAGASPNFTLPTGETLQGSGYTSGASQTVQTSAGIFSELYSPSQLVGEPTYVQVAPGDFIPTPANAAPNTPQFAKQ